jgi:RNA polymerase sigma-70 factor (ECF subfamily)
MHNFVPLPREVSISQMGRQMGAIIHPGATWARCRMSTEGIGAENIDREVIGLKERLVSRSGEAALEALMLGYQQGSAEAVNELVAQLSPALWRYFLVWGSRDQAEDLLQECWIRIQKSRHAWRPAEPLLPWVYAIARHTRLDEYRKRRRRESRETLVAELPDRPVQESRASAPDLERVLGELPESQREVVLMLKFSGMSLEEVARATASTVGSVKQKAHRAYERLRRILETEGR